MTTNADEFRPILVLNCGSSSIKFAMFDAGRSPLAREPFWGGRIEGIGNATATGMVSGSKPYPVSLGPDHPHTGALAHIRDRVGERLGGEQLEAVAHRVVHGGSKYFDPVRIDADLLADLHAYIPLAPLHQPFALEAIESLLDQLPDIPQVASFDTGFHHTLPLIEQMMPLPWDAWERGLRRYGFHGLSYEYMSIALPERFGDLASGRVIVAHLGSGASLCAMQGGRSVATTMGFSALDGLMMGTRCGSLDPGAVIYLMGVEKLTLEEVSTTLYRKSGLLGVSGLSSDPRVLFANEATNDRARVALDLYVRRAVREIGALVAVLGGVDLLVFTAGIGEHSARMRQRICVPLAFLGVDLDLAANQADAKVISTRSSAVTVAVEPTNEEWVIARHAARLVCGHSASGHSA